MTIKAFNDEVTNKTMVIDGQRIASSAKGLTCMHIYKRCLKASDTSLSYYSNFMLRKTAFDNS